MSRTAAPASRLSAVLSPAPDGFPALVPYVTAGYPRRDSLVEVLQAIERAGCVAAEIGLPFSDPLADGPTIQRSSHAALLNGMSVNRALEQVAAARSAGLRMPLVAMTYINPILSYGVVRFCTDAVAAGLEGLIVPDLPAGEAGDVAAAAAAAGLGLAPLVAPTTTSARLEEAATLATAFVYCVSVTGVTGARHDIAEEGLALLDRVRAVTSLPRALGFGLSRHDQLAALRGHAEAAVVGSALIDAQTAAGADAAQATETFCRALIGGDRGSTAK